MEADAPLSRIPLFVKAGSILPMAEAAQNTARAAEAEVEYRIYAGADCSFTLYRDSGDGYTYEQGEYELTELVWEEKTKKLFVNGTEQSENVVIYS